MTDEVMTNEAAEVDGEGLDEMIRDYEAEQAEAEAEANQPDPEEEERARKLAEKINSGFLKAVKFTQAPHVDIEQIVDREKGNEAFLPLAQEFGGEVPPWLAAMIEKYDPYIKAGWYMGTTIYAARKAEAQVLEYLERQRRQQQQEGAANGQESEPGTNQ